MVAVWMWLGGVGGVSSTVCVRCLLLGCPDGLLVRWSVGVCAVATALCLFARRNKGGVMQLLGSSHAEELLGGMVGLASLGGVKSQQAADVCCMQHTPRSSESMPHAPPPTPTHRMWRRGGRLCIRSAVQVATSRTDICSEALSSLPSGSQVADPLPHCGSVLFDIS